MKKPESDPAESFLRLCHLAHLAYCIGTTSEPLPAGGSVGGFGPSLRSTVCRPSACGDNGATRGTAAGGAVAGGALFWWGEAGGPPVGGPTVGGGMT